MDYILDSESDGEDNASSQKSLLNQLTEKDIQEIERKIEL